METRGGNTTALEIERELNPMNFWGRLKGHYSYSAEAVTRALAVVAREVSAPVSLVGRARKLLSEVTTRALEHDCKPQALMMRDAERPKGSGWRDRDIQGEGAWV